MDAQQTLKLPAEKTAEKPPKVTPERVTSDRLTAAYEAATDAERDKVQALIRRALGAPPSTEIIEFTPAMAAILFHDFNTQNRKWAYTTTLEYERQMRAGRWWFTNNALGFSAQNGHLIDGQHRLSALALSGLTKPFAVMFGMDLTSVLVIDTNKRRDPGGAIAIVQHRDLEESMLKTAIVRRADNFLAQLRGAKPALHGSPDTADYLVAHEALVDRAIVLGEQATSAIANPTLKLRDAQVLAFALLVSGWPELTIAEYLRTLESGQDVSEVAPFFVAARILEQEKRGERYTLTQKLALSLNAIQLVQRGVKAVKTSVMREAMKPKSYPKPEYPGTVATS
jgi:hypothetical protein